MLQSECQLFLSAKSQKSIILGSVGCFNNFMLTSWGNLLPLSRLHCLQETTQFFQDVMPPRHRGTT